MCKIDKITIMTSNQESASSSGNYAEMIDSTKEKSEINIDDFFV